MPRTPILLRKTNGARSTTPKILGAFRQSHIIDRMGSSQPSHALPLPRCLEATSLSASGCPMGAAPSLGIPDRATSSFSRTRATSVKPPSRDVKNEGQKRNACFTVASSHVRRTRINFGANNRFQTVESRSRSSRSATAIKTSQDIGTCSNRSIRTNREEHTSTPFHHPCCPKNETIWEAVTGSSPGYTTSAI